MFRRSYFGLDYTTTVSSVRTTVVFSWFVQKNSRLKVVTSNFWSAAACCCLLLLERAENRVTQRVPTTVAVFPTRLVWPTDVCMHVCMYVCMHVSYVCMHVCMYEIYQVCSYQVYVYTSYTCLLRSVHYCSIPAVHYIRVCIYVCLCIYMIPPTNTTTILTKST